MADSNLPRKILFVDDDQSIGQGIKNELMKHSIDVVTAADFNTALYLFNQQKFDVAVLELELEPVSGLVLAQKFRQNTQSDRDKIGLVISCGKGRSGADENLVRELGNLEFIDKPIKAIKLLSFLNRALQRKISGVKLGEAETQSFETLKRTGSVDEAIKIAKSSLEGLPLERTKLCCDLLEEAERYEEALAVTDQILSQSDEIGFMNRKARLLLKLGKSAEAKALLESADQAAPENIARIETLAKLYLEQNDPDASVEKMREMIKLNPDLQDLKFDLFRDLDNAGFQDHAIALCKETTKPKEVVRYYNNKGVSLSKSGESDAALKEYYTALLFYPKYKDNYRILFNIALAELGKKTPEGRQAAKDAITKCMELAPDFEKGAKLKERLFPAKKSA